MCCHRYNLATSSLLIEVFLVDKRTGVPPNRLWINPARSWGSLLAVVVSIGEEPKKNFRQRVERLFLFPYGATKMKQWRAREQNGEALDRPPETFECSGHQPTLDMDRKLLEVVDYDNCLMNQR